MCEIVCEQQCIFKIGAYADLLKSIYILKLQIWGMWLAAISILVQFDKAIVNNFKALW